MSQKDTTVIQKELRDAFDDMIGSLQAARDAIDTPELYPPPMTERNLAEGYRYVLGHLLGALERTLSDPLHPRFRRAIQPMNRATIDNSDAVYLSTEIDGRYSYRITGRTGDTRHWHGEAPVAGKRAPQYVIFELASGYAGDSGDLKELIPGTRVNTGTLDSAAIAVGPDGRFEILVAPEKPEDYAGNFLPSRRVSHDKEYFGNYLSCRELFHDWHNEDVMDLEILRLGCEREPRPPIDAAAAKAMMQRVGTTTRNQVHFWNAFYTVVLGTYGSVEGSLGGSGAGQFMPVNAMNEPNALGIATGGGQSTNIYAGGVYQLQEDEALLVEVAVPVRPCFMGFHLSNLWGESHDFESYQSNLNAHMLELDADGVYRMIVAHRDPGVANWIDTTGLPHGFTTIRWTYESQPVQTQWPTIKAQKIDFDDIAATLPPDTRRVSQDERAASILARHRHVQRRYRQY